jgi:photosystem II stability/assembly factor-like uncharacterized protein
MGEISMKAIRGGFVFGGFLYLIVSLSAQTTPAQRAAGQPAPAAKAQPRYKGIWEPVNYAEDISLKSVYFASAQTGWVSGGTGKGAGVILKTQDGGEHWSVQWGDPQGTEDAPSNFFFLDATHGWVRQGYNDLLHTTDGQTWVAGAKIDHYNSDYLFTSEKNGVAISGGPAIYRTADGGRNWKVVNQCSAKIQVNGLARNVECNWDKLHFPTPTTGYAIAWIDHSDIGVVGKTNDGGATWALSLTDVGVGYPSDVFFLDTNTGFMRRGNVYSGQLNKTTDGGASWKASASIKGQRLWFVDPEVGWSFYGRQLYFTTDGGQYWNSRQFKFPVEPNAFSLPTRDRAYVVGDHGMVYRYRVVPIEYAAAGGLDAPAMPAALGGPATQSSNAGQDRMTTSRAAGPAPPSQTISLAQTTDQVIAILGQPEKIVKLATKQVYYYKDLKVIFTDGKVTDVQ